ncbi:Aste57867_7305 [Aphanomyces stellatus]|uniref:Aste57867_7305 protein n=1 Tax=Aphanomyces stellatus TaxID=120398 RepID=A0A485KI40_9STRA|nr:hypothetical protein As57867_007279 [Aphanomyces stellatus]VFT84224.1 Aste57867_7305 [Aphanomyces stellatus]
MTNTDDDEAALDHEVLTLLSKKTPQEEEHAQYMVQYRKAKKAEVARLKKTFARLERLRDELKSHPRMLAWKEVARVFADVRLLGELQQKALLAQLGKQSELTLAMAQWVQMNTPIQMPLDATGMTWRHVSLPNDPTTRRLAKDWITQQMLHNMETMFHRYGFPAWDSEDVIDDADVSCEFDDDKGYTMVTRRDYKDTLSLAGFRSYIHSTVHLQSLVPDYVAGMSMVDDSIDNETRQVAIVSANEFANVLIRDVLTSEQYAYIVQQIQDDPHYDFESKCYAQRHRMIWCTYRKLADGTFRSRLLVLVSGPRARRVEDAPSVASSLEADARAWGVDWGDCPIHQRQLRYPTLWWWHFRQQIHAYRTRYYALTNHSCGNFNTRRSGTTTYIVVSTEMRTLEAIDESADS